MFRALEKSRNSRDIKAIAQICAFDSESFAELVVCIESNNPHISSLASWTFGHAVALNKSKWLASQQKLLLKVLQKTDKNYIQRNLLRAWQWVKVPEEIELELAETAMNFLIESKSDVAVKAFSLTVLEHLVLRIPELKGEVSFLIEKSLPHAGAAYKVRATKFLMTVAKMK